MTKEALPVEHFSNISSHKHIIKTDNYVGWNFNFGNTALLEWRGNAAGRMGPSPTYIHNGSGPSRNGHTQ